MPADWIFWSTEVAKKVENIRDGGPSFDLWVGGCYLLR